jgi:hopanoid biosynthesis associated protein HpnK
LIVTADDFGLASEVNEAVELAHTRGILTAASLMVRGTAVDDAVERARRLPSLRIGLHLVLCDGRPVLPPAAIPDLVDARGNLRIDMMTLGVEIFVRSKVRKQLAAEMDAQFAAYRATGLPLDHVNTHHHFHVHPTIAGLIFNIGQRYGMRAVRVPLEPPRMLNRIEPSASPDRVTRTFAALLGRRVRRRRLMAPDQVFGIAWSGAMTERRVAALLRDLPDGITEMYLHPATANSFSGANEGYRYTDELDALMAPEVREGVHSTAASTGGFADVAAA